MSILIRTHTLCPTPRITRGTAHTEQVHSDSWNTDTRSLLKPQAAAGRWCSGHLKLPTKLARQSLNEGQAGRPSLDRLQIEARTVVFDIEEKRLVLSSQPNPDGASALS